LERQHRNDPLLRELSADHGSYLTKALVDIARPAQISSDFAFGDAPDDDPYRQVIVIGHNATIPVELVLFAGFAFAVIAATVTVLVVRGRRRA